MFFWGFEHACVSIDKHHGIPILPPTVEAAEKEKGAISEMVASLSRRWCLGKGIAKLSLKKLLELGFMVDIYGYIYIQYLYVYI